MFLVGMVMEYKTCPCFDKTQRKGEAQAKKNPLNFGLSPAQYNLINLCDALSFSAVCFCDFMSWRQVNSAGLAHATVMTVFLFIGWGGSESGLCLSDKEGCRISDTLSWKRLRQAGFVRPKIIF